MGADVKHIVDAMAAACRSEDERAFQLAADELRQRVAVSPSGGSIGPRLAFGTLSPAGDTIGRAMLDTTIEHSLPLLELLATDRSAELRSIACRALGHVGKRWPRAVVPLAHQLAADTSWEVREFIANALDEVMCTEQGEFVFAVMQQWVHDADENVRRVPTNALMRYGRKHPKHVIALMGELRRDDSRYVRDNVVFCLGIIGAAKVRALGGDANESNPPRLMAVLREWAKEEDERTRWIVAKTLGRSWAKSCLAEATALLQELGGDGRKAVRVAVASSAKALAKMGADQ